jgi:hypothetical protein
MVCIRGTVFHDSSRDVCIFRDVSPEGRLMLKVGRRIVAKVNVEIIYDSWCNLIACPTCIRRTTRVNFLDRLVKRAGKIDLSRRR